MSLPNAVERNAVERITELLERARVDGGWDDEAVARRVLDELELDEDGKPIPKLDEPPDPNPED